MVSFLTYVTSYFVPIIPLWTAALIFFLPYVFRLFSTFLDSGVGGIKVQETSLFHIFIYSFAFDSVHILGRYC